MTTHNGYKNRVNIRLDATRTKKAGANRYTIREGENPRGETIAFNVPHVTIIFDGTAILHGSQRYAAKTKQKNVHAVLHGMLSEDVPFIDNHFEPISYYPFGTEIEGMPLDFFLINDLVKSGHYEEFLEHTNKDSDKYREPLPYYIANVMYSSSEKMNKKFRGQTIIAKEDGVFIDTIME